MEAAISKKTLESIEDLRKFVEKNGVVKDEVVEKLMALRPHYIEQNEPLVTRVIRMTAEYIEHFGYFNLNLLAETDEEDEDAEVEEEIDPEGEVSFTEMKENFLYLLDLFAHPDNQVNRDELQNLKQMYLDRDLF
jgi:hypothetical protein